MTARDLAIYLALFVAGGIGGYFVGRAERIANRGKSTRQRWLDIARVVTGLALLGLVLFWVVTTSSRARCQSDYFVAVSEALAERSEATGQDATSQREWLVSLLDGDVDPESVQDRIDALNELERARQAAPIPEPPRCR